MPTSSEKLRLFLDRLPGAASLSPARENLKEELLQLSAALSAPLDTTAAFGGGGFESEGSITNALMYQRSADLVAAGIQAMHAVQSGAESADLTADEIEGLEAIVLLIGRPALAISAGRPAQAPPEWEILETQRPAIEAVIRNVGRIELVGHPSYEWVGTGFMAGERVVMTNRHVATTFCAPLTGDQWAFDPGVQAFINFSADLESADPLRCRLAELIGIHHSVDLALFRVEAVSDDGRPVPSPLAVAGGSPQALQGRLVYLVGHPAWDGYRNDPIHMGRIFANLFNLKRLQPGKVIGLNEDKLCLIHDASTLGGNSGSCLLDLDSHKVIGLHYGGRYLEGNYAVPLWKLSQDELLVRAGIRFD